jgi:hypothetical protein
MYALAGTDEPWSRRLDHIICETPDIEFAYSRLQEAGFPSAWPIGRFWPGKQTAGIALGGCNLELVQPDLRPPDAATITTLVFEPVDLDKAADRLRELGLEVEIVEKWEDNPELLARRGFEPDGGPQLICRNAYPSGDIPFPFFFCEYAPPLRRRLGPEAFRNLAPITHVTLATPTPGKDWFRIDLLFGLPRYRFNVEIWLAEAPSERAEVIEIRSDRGPVDFPGWDARFQFV